VCPDPSLSPEPFDSARELAFVRAVMAGREADVVTFIERMLCVPRMLGAMNRRRGRPLDDHDLEDLVNDTIVIALRKLGEFRAIVPLEGWTYQLCYLEFLNAVRRRGRERQKWVELDDVAAAAGAGARYEYDDLYRALDELGGAEAEVIRMRHFAELTFQEIGVMLGLPANTAKTRYHRGMQRLAERLHHRRHREGDDE
jgi:RNA polymerase sigma-70 factor (ECF subfamily)